jgi:CubicO group peptidase (beta-lactamase class C family)
MVKRRDMLMLGLAAPFLTACGGGDSDTGPGVSPDHEDVTATSIAADDWPTAIPASQSVSAAALETLHGRVQTIARMRSLLVVRNGTLVHESYYGDAKSSDLQHIRSSTKTVSSLLIGQSIAAGKISGTSAPLSELLPRELTLVPNSVAGGVTVRRILQMRSGLAFNESTRMQEIFNTPNLTQLALSLPATGANDWNYDSASSHLLSPILAHAWGASDALAVATRTLFEPLGIKQAAWSRDASGTNHGSFGLKLRSRDFMKLAWMSLDGGNWQGRQVVPSLWLSESMSSHVVLRESDSAGPNMGYGYLWWMKQLGGRQVWMALGFGGQLAILVPSLRMVVVSTAQWNRPIDEGNGTESEIESLVGDFIATVTPA